MKRLIRFIFYCIKKMSKEKPPKSSLNTILTVIWSLLAFAMIYFSYQHHKQLVQQYNAFFDHKFKTVADKITAVSILMFFSGLMMFFMMCLRFVLQTAFNLKQGPLLNAFEAYTKDSIMSLIITVGIFWYILMQNNFGFQNHELILIMLWILVSRMMAAVGYVLTAITKLNFAEFGWVVQTVVNIIMLSQILGISLLNYI